MKKLSLNSVNRKTLSFLFAIGLILLPYQNCGQGFDTTNGGFESQNTSSSGSSDPLVGSPPPPNDPNQPGSTEPDGDPMPPPPVTEPTTPPPPSPPPPPAPGRLFPETMQFSFRRGEALQFTLTPPSPFNANISTRLTAVTIVSDEAWRVREYFGGQLNEGLSIPLVINSGQSTVTISLPSNRRVALTKRSVLRLSTGAPTNQLPQTIDVFLEPQLDDVVENILLHVSGQYATVGRTYDGRLLTSRAYYTNANWAPNTTLPQNVSIISNQSNLDQYAVAFLVHQTNQQQFVTYMNQYTRYGSPSVTFPIPSIPGRGPIVTATNGYVSDFTGVTEDRDGAYLVLISNYRNFDSPYSSPIYVASPVGKLKKAFFYRGYNTPDKLYLLTTTHRLYEYNFNLTTPQSPLTLVKEHSEHGPILDITSYGDYPIYVTSDKIVRMIGRTGTVNLSAKRADFVRIDVRSFRTFFVFADGSIEQFFFMNWPTGQLTPSQANPRCTIDYYRSSHCYRGSYRNPEVIIDPTQGDGMIVYHQDSQTFIRPTLTNFQP